MPIPTQVMKSVRFKSIKMQLLILSFVILNGVFVFAEVRGNGGERTSYCNHICSGCGDKFKAEDNICYCLLNKDLAECEEDASKKAKIFQMLWIPVHQKTRTTRKVQPVKGSFLDPVVANALEKPESMIESNQSELRENVLRKRSSKRSLPNHLGKKLDYDLNWWLPKINPAILESSGENKRRRREKRSMEYYQNYPRYNENEEDLCEIILEYPNSRGEEEKIQLLFPNAKGLDVEHEFYYEESSEEDLNDFLDDEDDDWRNPKWNGIPTNQKDYKPLYSRRHAIGKDLAGWNYIPPMYIPAFI